MLIREIVTYLIGEKILNSNKNKEVFGILAFAAIVWLIGINIYNSLLLSVLIIPNFDATYLGQNVISVQSSLFISAVIGLIFGFIAFCIKTFYKKAVNNGNTTVIFYFKRRVFVWEKGVKVIQKLCDGFNHVLLFILIFIAVSIPYNVVIVLIYFIGIYFIHMIFKNLLWHCAGANISLLENCPNDHSRYQNIGATIIMTALLAWISMGFALYSVFNSIVASILVGFVWACMIFVLDRTIVTSMQKPNINSIQVQGVIIWGVQGGTLAKFGENFREIGFAIIRLIIAVLISFVITKPLEIKIFESRLRPVLDEMKDKQAHKDSLGIWNNGERISIIQDSIQIAKNIEAIDGKIKNNEKSPTYIQLQNDLTNCNEGIKGEIQSKDNKIRGQENEKKRLDRIRSEDNYAFIDKKKGECDGIIRQLNADKVRIKQPCTNIEEKMRQENIRYRNELESAKKEKGEKLVQVGEDLEESNSRAREEDRMRGNNRKKAFTDNIIPQIQALEQLKADDNAMWYTSWLIMFMFTIIETAPVLAKLLSKRGQYDNAFEEAEIAKWVALQKIKAEQIQDMNVSLSAKEVISKTNIQELEAKAQRDALANENSHNQDTTHKLALQTAKHKKAYNEELSNYETLVSKIAEAQRKIALEQVEIWKNEQLEILKKKSNNNNPPTI